MLAMSFSRKAIAMMGNIDYISVAKKAGKIFFKSNTPALGFKLVSKNDCARKTVTFPANSLKILSENWVGYYNLRWDANRQLFYIDIDAKAK